MKKLFFLTLGVFLFVFGSISAQETKNIFLDRKFWKEKPTLADVKQKIAEGHDPAALSRHSFDAISYALIEEADKAIIKYLLTQKGNSVNKLTHDGRTYIFWAAYKSNLEMMKYFHSEGAKTDIVDNHGYSLLNFSATTGQTNPKLYDFLIENGANPAKEHTREGANALLLLLPHLEDFTMINYFTDKGLKLNDTDKHGNGAINYAAKKGNKTIIEALIKKGLPYKTHNKNGGNAMLFAAQGGRGGYNSLDFFKYLEDLGITPKVVNKDGENPLHHLAWRNTDLPTLQYFIDKGNSPDQQDKEHNTPLLNAAGRNELEPIKLLAKNSKNLGIQNTDGKSVLSKALYNTPEVLSFFLEEGADVNVIDKNGNNLAFYLIKSYRPDKEEEFLKKAALLTDKGFDITKTQKDGSTLYHLAVAEKEMKLLEKIKQYKIDINTKNAAGFSPLQKAAMTAKNTEIITFLLENKADKSVLTNLNESVYDLAKENEALKNTDISFLK